MGPDDLVLCSGTLRRGIPFAERLAAASDAGFAGVSLWGRDYAAARAEGLSDSDLSAMLADHGLAVGEVDPAWWWPPGASGVALGPELDTEDVFCFGEAELFGVAEAVGARSINAVDVFGTCGDLDELTAAFAGLCSRAAEHGLVVHLEWLSWSKIPDLGTALHVVRSAGRPNGGLNIDAWHFVRTGSDLEELRSVPGPLIKGIQLCDGSAEPGANLIEETLHHRILPGEGAFDLAGLVRALADTGTEAPVGVEVFSDALHRLPTGEAARQAAETTRRVMGAGG